MHVTIDRESKIARSARVTQVEGMFDVPKALKSEVHWDFDFDLPESWHIGVIVGPSGSGKSTMSRELFGDKVVERWEWPQDKAIVDGFPKALSVRDVTGLLTSVGLSSPPIWLRPYDVLSTGERFRADMARTLAELPDFAVVDEYTSVVDRVVAQVGSAALAKAVRRRDTQFIAVTCHYDVLEWLEPDWVFDMATQRLARGDLQRPQIPIDIFRVDHTAWRMFKPHHYLTGDLNRSARCYLATWDGRPVAFSSWLPHFGRNAPKTRRSHRTVALPDYQGCGIGMHLVDHLASAWRALGYTATATAAHPAVVAYRTKSPNWIVTRGAQLSAAEGNTARLKNPFKHATDRLASSFRFVGTPMADKEAARCLLDWGDEDEDGQ